MVATATIHGENNDNKVTERPILLNADIIKIELKDPHPVKIIKNEK